MNRNDRIVRGTTSKTLTRLDGSTTAATFWSDAPRPEGMRFPRGTSFGWFALDDGTAAVYCEVTPAGYVRERREPDAWRVERDAARYGMRRVTAADLRAGDVIGRSGDGFTLGYVVPNDATPSLAGFPSRYTPACGYVVVDHDARYPHRYYADAPVYVIDYPADVAIPA